MSYGNKSRQENKCPCFSLAKKCPRSPSQKYSYSPNAKKSLFSSTPASKKSSKSPSPRKVILEKQKDDGKSMEEFKKPNPPCAVYVKHCVPKDATHWLSFPDKELNLTPLKPRPSGANFIFLLEGNSFIWRVLGAPQKQP